MTLVADEAPGVFERSPWRIQGSYSYGYIPTQGHQPKDIRSESDINCPSGSKASSMMTR
jgi:hypothetical protein